MTDFRNIENKIVVIGNEKVGKTALTNWARGAKFNWDHFKNKEPADFWQINKNIPDIGSIDLKLCDTNGGIKYRDYIERFFSDASVALIVYDVCDWESFFYVGSWLKHVRRR